MGFFAINDQNKVRVNLSEEAYQVLLHDVSDFKFKNMTSLLNNILVETRDNGLTCEDALDNYRILKEEELANIRNVNISDIVDQLVNDKKEKIKAEKEKLKTHKRNQHGFYFRISNAIREWLEKYSSENEFYDSLEQYLNYIFENYAAKPHYEREKIAIYPRISLIKTSIAKSEWVDFFSPEHNSHRYLFPIDVMSDIYNTHVYLVCFSLNDKSEFEPAAYRLSSLPETIQIESAKYIRLKPSDLELTELNKQISSRGIQFLSEPISSIKIMLTPYGQRVYNRSFHLRPEVNEIIDITGSNNKIYCFTCTQTQAFYYFIKFVKDALVVEPIELQDKFKKEYEASIAQYIQHTHASDSQHIR